MTAQIITDILSADVRKIVGLKKKTGTVDVRFKKYVFEGKRVESIDFERGNFVRFRGDLGQTIAAFYLDDLRAECAKNI